MVSEKTVKITSVCFVSPKAYPLFDSDCKGVFGGAEVDLYLLSTELAKDPAFSVSFVTADYGQPDSSVREGVRLIRSIDFKQGGFRGALKVWRAMKSANADIYVLKTVSPGVPLAAFFCRIYGRAFVYRTASISECNGEYAKEHRAMGRIFNWSLCRAKAVMAQNKGDKENLLRTTGVESAVIPNGHRFSELSCGDRKSILWVGRSAVIKGPRRFLELARKVPSERFVMICQEATGDESYDMLVEEARAVENLEFINYVPFNEVIDYFRRARVLVNTSDSEGFPNTFVEACKCATAILSFKVNPDDFLRRYSCGLVCDGSVETMTDNLKLLLEGDRYVEFGNNGRRYAEEHHDISKIVEQYKVIFEELSDELCR